MIRSRNCYFCKYYKDEYCENLELKPCYPQKGCEDFSKRNELEEDAEKIHKRILKLLEQETVSKEVYDHEYFLRKEFELKIDKLQRQLEEQAIKADSVLDKIRAEIESQREEVSKKHSENEGLTNYYFGLNDGLKDARDIIDKYKSESEE